MGMIHIFERSGDDSARFDDAMRRAKSGLMEACEIWENMKAQFSQRAPYYDERYTPSPSGMDYRYSERDMGFDGRGRNSMGQFR